MATDRRSERTALRGLLVPDVGLTFDVAESTLTQAGPRAGLPVPDRRTTTALVATGEQSAAFDVEVVRGGAIGTTLDTVGQFAYVQDGTTYGWDLPIVLRGWDVVQDVASATPCVRPSGVVRIGGNLIAATTISGATTFDFSLYRRPFGESFWEDVGLSAFTGAVSPVSTEPRSLGCLLVLPSGRVLAYYVTLEGGDRWDLVMAYSDDEGASWGEPTTLQTLEVYTSEAPSAAGWSEILGICAAYANGQVALFVNSRLANTEPGANKSRDGFVQYASTDLGQTFVQVAESNRSVALSWDCGAGGSVCVAKDGTILFAFVGVTSSVNRAFICRLGTAFSPFNTTETELTDEVYAGTASSTALSRFMVDWDCAIVTDDNGVAWAYLRDGQEIYPFRSEDNGVTWLSQGVTNQTPSIAHVYRSGNSDSRLRDIVACPWLGGIALIHDWDADSGAYAQRVVGSAFLGGWSTNPLRQIDGEDLSDRFVFDTTWLPLDEPSDVSWTKVGAGTATLGPRYLTLVTAAQALIYTRSISGGGRIAVRFVCAVRSGGAGTRQVFFAAKVGNGTGLAEVELRISETAVVVYDTLASSILHTFTVDAYSGVEVCFGATVNALRVFVAERSPDGPRNFQFVSVIASSTASADPTTISWGHGLASTATSWWYEFHFAEGGFLDGDDFWAEPTDVMPGAPLSPYSAYVASGVSVRAEGGPAWLGDSWALSPRYEYGIERTDPVDSPSPRRGWRSTTDADDVELAWTWNSDHDPGHLMGALVGIGLFNVNFSAFTVQTLDSMGAWNSLTGEVSAGDPDFSSMDVSVKGHTVAPSGTASPKPFLKLNELAGASLYLGPGCVRRIKSNSAGRWSTGNGQQARIVLDSVDGTEPATSTTAEVIPKDCVLVTRLPSTEIRGIRLLIEGQDTAEGFFQIGTAVLGHVEVFADEYSWGRTIDLEPSVERTTLRGGTTRTRVLAPLKRRVSFGWAEGVDTSQIEGEEPEPDYFTSSSTASSLAVASAGATPSQAFGLASLLDSGRVPIVYLPSIPMGSTGNDTHIMNRRDELVLAQLIPELSFETIQGDENSDEVIRVSNLELEEVT